MTVRAPLVDALARRDFVALADCFDADAKMRALLPRGPDEFNGVDAIVGAFQTWFGQQAGFEVLDASVENLGNRVHLAWRFRVDSTPRGATGWHVIEQQVYAQGGDRIDALDLLCTGFMPESSLGQDEACQIPPRVTSSPAGSPATSSTDRSRG